jgi:hypothetical protein
MIKTTYLNVNYLSNSYLDEYMKNLNEDISPLIIENNSGITAENFLGTMNYGFKSVVTRYFELIRFLGIVYYNKVDYDFLNAPEFLEISKIK